MITLQKIRKALQIFASVLVCSKLNTGRMFGQCAAHAIGGVKYKGLTLSFASFYVFGGVYVDKKEKPGFYAIIPAHVRYDSILPDKAKLLYGEITALCDKYGQCWAGNQYFAGLYSISTRQITRLLAALALGGYVGMELVYKPGSREIERRIIRITPIDKNVYTPIDKNVQDIITINNRESKITKKNAPGNISLARAIREALEVLQGTDTGADKISEKARKKLESIAYYQRKKAVTKK